MTPTIDDIFRQAHALSVELDQMEEGDPNREAVLRKQSRLRTKAQTLANTRRHPASVENEMAMLVARLDEIDALFITKGYSEKHLKKGFSDPGAYSATINDRLEVQHAAEVDEIQDRLAELRRIKPANDGS